MKKRMKTYTLGELRRMKGGTNWKRFEGTSDKEIIEQILRDPDLALPTEKKLKKFRRVQPRPARRKKGPRGPA